jgi:hypothetical protein
VGVVRVPHLTINRFRGLDHLSSVRAPAR